MDPHAGYLLPDDSVADLAAWIGGGGGEGLTAARRIGPAATIDVVRQAKLRGRGGAGFPTGVKWAGAATGDSETQRFLVCNAAEGEPGTFKDRMLMRRNPYQLIEGIAVAAFAIGADTAYIGIKDQYRFEIDRLEAAATEMAGHGMLDDLDLRVVGGPDDYLLGEEKALLEVIEGGDPLPRVLPPYLHGLHVSDAVGSGSMGPGASNNPTVVNNVETLCHVPHILARGSAWFRSIGTEDSPGTMIFTVSGDVRREAVVELPMGTPLALLVYGVGEGPEHDHAVSFVLPGASNAPVASTDIDVPMDFVSMRRVGSGLGSGGMIVGDEASCPVGSTRVLVDFLATESCGQCPPCKLGTAALRDGLAALPGTDGLDEIAAWLVRVTDSNRCGLGAGAKALVDGLLAAFPSHVADHIDGRCGAERVLPLAKFSDYLPEAGRFVLAEPNTR